MKQIKNIIFDLGGVLLNLDYSRTKHAFEKLGIDNFDSIYSQAQQSNLFDLFETGKIDRHHFLDGMKQYLPPGITSEQITNAWNGMLLDLPIERLELLKTVSKNYRIFLLSNTNEIHIDAFEKILFDQHNLKGLEPLFEKVYYSSRIQKRKPNAEIFEFVMNENKLNLSETVFFDDSIQHIKGAERVGLTAIFVDTEKTTITNFFDSTNKLILQ